jgi:LPXTG-site transpeptidase (sortase) family protein
MRGTIEFTVRLIQAGKRVYARKWNFLGVFAVVFLGSIFTLGQLNLLPEMSPSAVVLAANPHLAANTNVLAPIATVELPTKIEIPAINLAATIANPTTTDVAVLDQKLLKGAVRYPTSASLGETGNVVLFGHSSYLPIVSNQAYKTFNGIQKLVAGDVVTVYSSDTAYTYQVRSVAKESANDAGIPLSVAGRVLTLATCDSFGAKTDRFVVVADFVESHSISSQG